MEERRSVKTQVKGTTRIVGPQERFDQRNQMHTQAGIGGLGEKVKERWTKESRDPFRRIFYPEKRAMNVPMRSWRDVAEGPVNPDKVQVDDPAQMATRIKEVGRFLGADLVGVCELNPAYVYSHTGLRIDFAKGTAGKEIKLPHRHAISLAVEMNFNRMLYSPGWIDNAEVGLGYLNAAKAAVSLAAYIRELGYPARAHFFINEWVLHVPIAMDAGLGELSRNGILITAPFGPRVRLSTVTTDLPMTIDQPVDIGAVSTCEVCKKCADNCPSQAIPHGGKEIVRGVEKWNLDAGKCMRFWVANPLKWNDCARCIAVCPWNRPNVWYHNLSTKAVGRSKVAIKFLLWIDDFIRGKRPKPVIKWLEYTEGGSPISDKPVE
jgi:reductive dehalogenase